MSEKKPAPERTRDLKPFGLRMSPEVKEAVENAAKANGRSMNAEIVARLERYDREVALVLWQQKEMERLRQERDNAERELHDDAVRDVTTVLKSILPYGLLTRIVGAAAANRRPLLEEVTQALEASYPAPTGAEQAARYLAVLLKPLDGYTPRDPVVGQHLQLMRDHLAKLEASLRGEGDSPEVALANYLSDFPIGDDDEEAPGERSEA